MSIDTFSTQILLGERLADLRHEAHQQRTVGAARLTRPRRPTGFRRWWRQLFRQQLGARRPARTARARHRRARPTGLSKRLGASDLTDLTSRSTVSESVQHSGGFLWRTGRPMEIQPGPATS